MGWASRRTSRSIMVLLHRSVVATKPSADQIAGGSVVPINLNNTAIVMSTFVSILVY
jgi:hypothetical protein